jgi:hypothetical protein
VLMRAFLGTQKAAVPQCGKKKCCPYSWLSHEINSDHLDKSQKMPWCTSHFERRVGACCSSCHSHWYIQ